MRTKCKPDASRQYDVIISTFNGEKYILQQVSSIVRQTIPPTRIIIRDDGSSDSTTTLLKEIAAAHCPVEIIFGQNVGYIKSFEALVRNCTSEIIFFCDQDDVWLEEKAENILQEFRMHKDAKCIFSDACVTAQDLTPVRRLVGRLTCTNIGVNQLLWRNIVTGATLACKREFLFSHCVPFHKQVPHDFWIGCKAAAVEGLIYHSNPLILYRQHEANAIGASKRNIVARAFSSLTLKSRNRRTRTQKMRDIILEQSSVRDACSDELHEFLKLKSSIYNNNMVRLVAAIKLLRPRSLKYTLRDPLLIYDAILKCK